jgi:hypothetical protein
MLAAKIVMVAAVINLVVLVSALATNVALAFFG